MTRTPGSEAGSSGLLPSEQEMDTGGLHRSWNRNRLGHVAVLLSGLALAGCASSHKVGEYDILWYDGRCIFHAKGMSVDQAKEMQREWDFEDCDIKIEGFDNSKSRGVKKP